MGSMMLLLTFAGLFIYKMHAYVSLQISWSAPVAHVSTVGLVWRP